MFELCLRKSTNVLGLGPRYFVVENAKASMVLGSERDADDDDDDDEYLHHLNLETRYSKISQRSATEGPRLLYKSRLIVEPHRSVLARYFCFVFVVL